MKPPASMLRSRFLFLLAASGLVSMTLAVSADTAADWAKLDSIVQAIQPPQIPARDFFITDFGAKPDGTSDARPAIVAAIKQASAAGGGRVVIPRGNWLSQGPIHLASRINLHVSEGATLLFSPEPKHYLPVVLTRWEGTELYSYSPLLYAFEVQDVAITGTGVIDGNAASEFHTWIGAKQQRDQLALRQMGVDGTPAAQRVFAEGTHLRPSMIQFFRAERVLLEGYTLHHSPFWVNHPFILKNVEGLKLENVTIAGQTVNGELDWKQAAPAAAAP